MYLLAVDESLWSVILNSVSPSMVNIVNNFALKFVMVWNSGVIFVNFYVLETTLKKNAYYGFLSSKSCSPVRWYQRFGEYDINIFRVEMNLSLVRLLCENLLYGIINLKFIVSNMSSLIGNVKTYEVNYTFFWFSRRSVFSL